MARTPKTLIGRLRRRMKRLRIQRGLTQEEAASGLGISPYYYRELETGRKKAPSLELLENIQEFYQLEPYELFQDPDEVERALQRLKRTSGQGIEPKIASLPPRRELSERDSKN